MCLLENINFFCWKKKQLILKLKFVLPVTKAGKKIFLHKCCAGHQPYKRFIGEARRPRSAFLCQRCAGFVLFIDKVHIMNIERSTFDFGTADRHILLKSDPQLLLGEEIFKKKSK